MLSGAASKALYYHRGPEIALELSLVQIRFFRSRPGGPKEPRASEGRVKKSGTVAIGHEYAKDECIPDFHLRAYHNAYR